MKIYWILFCFVYNIQSLTMDEKMNAFLDPFSKAFDSALYRVAEEVSQGKSSKQHDITSSWNQLYPVKIKLINECKKATWSTIKNEIHDNPSQEQVQRVYKKLRKEFILKARLMAPPSSFMLSLPFKSTASLVKRDFLGIGSFISGLKSGVTSGFKSAKQTLKLKSCKK